MLIVMSSLYVIFIIVRRPFFRMSDNIRVGITEILTIVGMGL